MSTIKPNNLEQIIIDAAKSAQRFHIKMTDGEYVSFSHESFLQNYLALQLFIKTRCRVNVDPSKRKIREGTGSRGRKPLDMQSRFDVVLWKISTEQLKAVIEIKQVRGSNPVLDDIRKVSDFLKTSSGRGASGYVLYYTDQSRMKKWNGKDARFIRKRFKVVEEKMHNIVEHDRRVGLRAQYVCDKTELDPWGFALFRC